MTNQCEKIDKISQENGKTLPQSHPDIRSETERHCESQTKKRKGICH